MKKLFLASILSLMAAGTAQAAGAYAEVSYSGLTYKNTTTATPLNEAKFDPAVLRAIVGFSVNEYLSVEGLTAFGNDTAYKVYNGGVEIPNMTAKLKNVLGFYVKPQFNVTPEFQIFTRLGYAQVNADYTQTVESVSQSVKYSTGAFSYGIGASYAVTKALYITADYMAYGNQKKKVNDVETKIDPTGWSVGVGYHF